MTDEAMSGVLSAMGPVLFAAMESELRNKGITLSDTETFANILIEEFMAGYLDAMRSEMAAIYLEEFYPEELAGIAAFYAAPAGQAMAAKTAILAQRSAAVGARVGQQAALEVGDRVAARLRAEGVTLTADPSMRDKPSTCSTRWAARTDPGPAPARRGFKPFPRAPKRPRKRPRKHPGKTPRTALPKAPRPHCSPGPPDYLGANRFAGG
ncbi:MAG: DUF2059 domain-containing protein [Paracoccaceae bacterium]